MKITIIGTGYVGLVTGACLAELGNDVFCLDVDPRKIDMLNSGGIPIHEPGLEEVVARNRAAGRLQFSTDIAASVAHGQLQFIAVGTPPDEDGSADLQYVLAAARNIGRHMDGYKVIIDKSTVPVGTADRVAAAISEELAARGQDAAQFAVVSNPEFLKEGAAVEDFMRPDRIVIGTDDTPAGTRARDLMKLLYAPFNRNHERVYWMDVRSAEFTKYAANAMLATRISFMNELANLAEVLGADIEAVRHGMGLDPRIGSQFLYAGMGYGGSCFPKDVKALVKTGGDHGQVLHILEATELVNDNQKNVLFKKLTRFYGGVEGLKGKTVAVWGLSFKPNTDDMREAPSLVLLKELFDAGCHVRAYDPVASSEALRVLEREHGAARVESMLTIVSSAAAATEGADALVLVTEWKEFRAPDFAGLATILRDKAIFDGRNIYDPAVVAAAGLAYEGIGRVSRTAV